MSVTLNNLGVICLSQALLHTELPPCLSQWAVADRFAFMLGGRSNPSAETAPGSIT